MRKGATRMKIVVSLAVFGLLFWVAFKVENKLGLLNGKGQG